MASLGRHFQEKMFVELNRQMGGMSCDCPQTLPGHVVCHRVAAVFEATQFDWSLPVIGKEGVVHVLVLANRMGLGKIEAYVIQLAKVLSFGQHLLAIDAEPLLEVLFTRGSEIGFASLRDERGKNELRSHNAADTDRGGEVVAAITQFYVIAKEWDRVSDQSF